MHYIITAITCIFDAFIILTYMNGIFTSRRENISDIGFYLSFAIVEIILLGNDYLFVTLDSTLSAVITSLLSLLTSFCLTFLYNSNWKERLFTCISFQIFVLVSEYLLTVLVNLANPDLLQSIGTSLFITFMSCLSKILLFTIVLLMISFWKQQFQQYPKEYNILLFVTPLITLLILLFSPISQDNAMQYRFFFESLCILLSILNICNYILLQRTFRYAQFQIENAQLSQQIQFQEEKYQQISAAYQNCRRIVHDVDKQYNTLQQQLKQQAYAELESFLSSAKADLKANSTKYNTGNLVIDSFLTNYDILAQNHNISFESILNVTSNDIPLNNYELSIVLGNLLDNSLHACQTQTAPIRYIHVHMVTSSQKHFIINITNTKTPVLSHTVPPVNYPNLSHGYGLENVRRIVDDKHGTIHWEDEGDTFIVKLMVPIIKKKNGHYM